ncbi:hypothetical protein AAY473_039225 [Plecturocebus cupreus]
MTNGSISDSRWEPRKTGFHRVGQAGLEPLTSGDLPASVSQSAGMTGVSHRPRAKDTVLISLLLTYHLWSKGDRVGTWTAPILPVISVYADSQGHCGTRTLLCSPGSLQTVLCVAPPGRKPPTAPSRSLPRPASSKTLACSDVKRPVLDHSKKNKSEGRGERRGAGAECVAGDVSLAASQTVSALAGQSLQRPTPSRHSGGARRVSCARVGHENTSASRGLCKALMTASRCRYFEMESGCVAQAGERCGHLGSLYPPVRVQAVPLTQPPKSLGLQAAATCPASVCIVPSSRGFAVGSRLPEAKR